MNTADKFMLISVCDREILTERFPTIKAAQDQMYKEMVEWGGISEKDFLSGAEEYEECDFGYHKYGGYVNDGNNHADLDWLIVEL